MILLKSYNMPSFILQYHSSNTGNIHGHLPFHVGMRVRFAHALSSGDGLVGIRTQQGFRAQRLCLTDSGRYPMAINHFAKGRRADWGSSVNRDLNKLSKSAKQLPTPSTTTNLACGLLNDSSDGESVFSKSRGASRR